VNTERNEKEMNFGDCGGSHVSRQEKGNIEKHAVLIVFKYEQVKAE
jgi:hypothetical protein